MIIDLILDRKDGVKYSAREFYYRVMEYETIFKFENSIERSISRALDYGTNKDVQKALCAYIDSQGYNAQIKDYINSVDWIDDYA